MLPCTRTADCWILLLRNDLTARTDGEK